MANYWAHLLVTKKMKCCEFNPIITCSEYCSRITDWLELDRLESRAVIPEVKDLQPTFIVEHLGANPIKLFYGHNLRKLINYDCKSFVGLAHALIRLSPLG